MEKKIIQVDEKVPVKMLIPLSLQHMFAMFGASVLVPFLFGIQSGDRASDERCRHTGLYRCNKRKSTGVPGFQFCISGSGGAGH